MQGLRAYLNRSNLLKVSKGKMRTVKEEGLLESEDGISEG